MNKKSIDVKNLIIVFSILLIISIFAGIPALKHHLAVMKLIRRADALYKDKMKRESLFAYRDALDYTAENHLTTKHFKIIDEIVGKYKNDPELYDEIWDLYNRNYLNDYYRKNNRQLNRFKMDHYNRLLGVLLDMNKEKTMRKFDKYDKEDLEVYDRKEPMKRHRLYFTFELYLGIDDPIEYLENRKKNTEDETTASGDMKKDKTAVSGEN